MASIVDQQKMFFSNEIISQISGYFMQVGAAQDLLKSDAGMPNVMNMFRCTKMDTLIRYLVKNSYYYFDPLYK
jgi:hypothetical protein